MIVDIVSKTNQFIWGTPFILILLFTGVYLTIKLRFPQIKILFSIKEIVNKDKKVKGKSEITSYKALMTILAGSLGTGNITGVASAIVIGGIGSLFWLFVSGIFAMAISYTENYIVLLNRKYDRRKGFYGGTMYVLEEVLGKKGFAIFFSVVLLFATMGIGNMVQSNSLANLLNNNTGISKNIIGVMLSLVTCYIVFGGKHRIAKISSIIVPICTIIYLFLCSYIIYTNRDMIIPGINQIISCAFGGKQLLGGIVGLSISKTMGVGFSRGMFSNEAGMGSAPLFIATVEEDNLKEQARVGSMSIVVDTLLVCTLTGLTMVVSGKYNISNINEFISAVFGIVPYGNFLLNICMIFFVIATIPCWEYYGEQAVKYLFKFNFSIYLFRVIYVVLIYIGSISLVGLIWDMSAIANALMALPNIYMIYKLIDDIKD